MQYRQEGREPSACTILADRVDDLEQRLPGTCLVISSGGRVLLATAPGSNGTGGTRTSAVRTPISRASRSAAGRDHKNFQALPIWSYRRREVSCHDPPASGRPDMR